MKLSFIVLSLSLFLLFVFSGCSRQQYNFDYDPPYINARFNEVFPASVKQTPRKLTKLPLPDDFLGFEASYVEGKVTMRLIKCPDEDKANNYFATTIIEEFKEKKTRSYDNLQGRWKAQARDADGRRWLAWVNEIWIFVLSGADREYFDLVVRACLFVSKKEKN